MGIRKVRMKERYNKECESCGNSRSIGIINKKYYCEDCIWRIKREKRKNEKKHTQNNKTRKEVI